MFGGAGKLATENLNTVLKHDLKILDCVIQDMVDDKRLSLRVEATSFLASIFELGLRTSSTGNTLSCDGFLSPAFLSVHSFPFRYKPRLGEAHAVGGGFAAIAKKAKQLLSQVLTVACDAPDAYLLPTLEMLTRALPSHPDTSETVLSADGAAVAMLTALTERDNLEIAIAAMRILSALLLSPSRQSGCTPRGGGSGGGSVRECCFVRRTTFVSVGGSPLSLPRLSLG